MLLAIRRDFAVCVVHCVCLCSLQWFGSSAAASCLLSSLWYYWIYGLSAIVYVLVVHHVDIDFSPILTLQSFNQPTLYHLLITQLFPNTTHYHKEVRDTTRKATEAKPETNSIQQHYWAL